MKCKKWQPIVWLLVTIWFVLSLVQKAVHYDPSIIWIVIYAIGVESALLNYIMSLRSYYKNGENEA